MPDAEQEAVILGVHVAAGVLWFACVKPSGGYVEDRDNRLVLEDERLGEDRALSELEESLRAMLMRVKPREIALLDAGASKQARSPSVAHRRGHMEAVLLIAAHRTGTRLVRVTHPAVRREFGVSPAKPALRALVAKDLGIEQPTNWNNRAPACATALVLARSRG